MRYLFPGAAVVYVDGKLSTSILEHIDEVGGAMRMAQVLEREDGDRGWNRIFNLLMKREINNQRDV